jgi:hypothetical protein
MMRITAKAPLTGTKRLLRSSIGDRILPPPNRETLSVAVRSRADRIYHGAAGAVAANRASLTAEVVAANQAFPIAVVAKVLLVEVSEVVRRGNRATVVVQAARARRQEGAVVPEVVAAEEEEAVAAVVVAVAGR